jgi:hypothetical protein
MDCTPSKRYALSHTIVFIKIVHSLANLKISIVAGYEGR